MTPVLDACVFIAAISPKERHHRQARSVVDGHPDSQPFLVPDLFRVEVASALARRGEPDAFVETVDALLRGPRFYSCPLDAELLERAVHVARVARVRAYDAVYVALALAREQPLYTLDRELAERATAAFPELDVS